MGGILMNANERKMVVLLRNLQEKHYLIGIKTEFEGEGARLEDIMRQKEICMSAGLPITLKIGGCEAHTDMALAKTLGVDKLVAPMVETPFALAKYVDAVKGLFGADELEDVHLAVNIETISAYRCYDEMLATQQFQEVYAIAIGRSDLALSMGLTKKEVDSDEVLQVCKDIMQKTKEKYPNVLCIVGGMRGEQSIASLRSFGSLLGAYETRKMIFAAAALENNPLLSLKRGLEFEILWYQTKRAYYEQVAHSDDSYVQRIQATYDQL
jgi:hypothetical protein